MSSAIPRIVDELKQSNYFKGNLALHILDADIELLRDSIYEQLNVKVNKFLLKYERMIKNVCNNRRYYLGDESRDCEQFIRMSLCKLYKKRYAYTNFDKVVKSAIKRKAIDFSKTRNSNMKMTVTETDFMSKVDDEKSGEDIGLYKDELACEEQVYFDFKMAVFRIRDLVNEDGGKVFTIWDRRLLDIICENIRRGNYVVSDMFDHSEYNKTELCFRFKVLSKKIREHFDRSMFL